MYMSVITFCMCTSFSLELIVRDIVGCCGVITLVELLVRVVAMLGLDGEIRAGACTVETEACVGLLLLFLGDVFRTDAKYWVIMVKQVFLMGDSVEVSEADCWASPRRNCSLMYSASDRATLILSASDGFECVGEWKCGSCNKRIKTSIAG